MIKFVMDLLKKYEEMISYLFFGVLAFFVNTGAYAGAAKVLGADNNKMGLVFAANIFAWVVAVLFAYWTNRTFVFKSGVRDRAGVWKEFSAFIGARLVTGVLDQIIMYVMVGMLDVDDIAAKVVCNVVVTVSNYIFSKLWIFKGKEA